MSKRMNGVQSQEAPIFDRSRGLTSNLISEIKKAAKSVAGQWPGVVDQDDVEQSIHLHLMERESSVEKILGMEPAAKYRAIVGIGHQLASQERANYAHYKGNYRYSVAEVKDLLKSGALQGTEYDIGVQDCAQESVSSSGDHQSPVLDSVSDLRVALHLLEERHKPYADAVVKRYLFEERPTIKSEEDALRRGTEALAAEMNRVHRTQFAERDDGLGTRKVVSRLRALDTSGSDWDGDE